MGGGQSQQPNRLFQTRVNQSVYGLPYPWVMGTAQVQQQILWIDGFVATQQQSGGKGGSGGGKGGGGKSGGTFYTYTADVVAALCNGPINGIGDVWSGQSWLGNPNAAETYTISGAGVYTPVNATSAITDLGAGFQTAYSASYTDYGSSGPVTLSGTDYPPLKKVSYGTTLTTGLYSINPADGTYHFNNTTDAGKVVHLSYSFLLTHINQQENDLIPSGKTIAIGGSSAFAGDLGVRDLITGAAFTKVSGTPTLAGTYSVTGSGPATYHFSTPDIAREVTITYSINDPNAVGQGQSTMMNFTLNGGTPGQSPYAFLTASYPGAAFGFTSLATILYQPMGLGASAEIQQNKFEVVTPDVYGTGIEDCNPVTCITNVLTNGQCGLGVGPIPFPTSVLDNGASGTWGAAAPAGTRTASSTAWNWFTANNFFISPVIDAQSSAASIVGKWLEAGMCAGFMSEGLLKLVPYGDTTTAANGVTWTAPANFIVALDDTTFVGKEGEDPVKISRVSAHDAWNVVQVQWDNRLNQYSPEITQESDQSLINRWGERREDPQNWNFIHTINAATFSANMRLKHGSYIRNIYEFTLDFSFSYLEPMDVVTISTTSLWAAGLNNANLGVVNLPIRITKIVDDPITGLHITAEDYPFGAHQPTLYNKQISNGDVVANAFADPGSSEVVMFEATNRLTGFAGDQIWIGACGTSQNYGFTNIWVAQTPFTVYEQIGTIRAPARMGVLHSTFGKTLSGSPAAYDPDSADQLIIDLVENCQALTAGTTLDADNNNTMCFVDGEIVSYSALTVTGQDQITMGVQPGSPPTAGYLRRGQMGSTISSHAAGTLFMRLDNAIFKFTYDPTWRNQTLQFKFQAVNAFGNNAQPLSSLTPVSFTLPGVNQGTVDASSGLLIGPAGSLDNITNGVIYIKAPIRVSGTAITIPNSDFEASSTLPPPGWLATSGTTLSYDTVTPYSGTQSLKVSSPSQYGAAQSIQRWSVTPGDAFMVASYMKSGNGIGIPCTQFMFFDKNGGYIGGVQPAGTTSTTWAYYTATGTAPANTVYGQFSLQNNSVTPSTCEFDNIFCWRQVPLGTQVIDGPSNFSATSSTLTYRPLTNPLTSHGIAAGSPATGVSTISVASFTMRTSSKGDLPTINSGSITALNTSTLYYVYYDDATLAGGSVTYNATTTKETAINGTARFFVGSIVTPAAGAPTTAGNGDGGVGSQGGGTSVYLFGATTTATNNVNATVTNPINAIDGNLTTSALLATTVNGIASSQALLTLSAASPTSAPWSSLTLNILSQVLNFVDGGGGRSTTVTLSVSFDGGVTYPTTLYTVTKANRALTTDQVVLNNSQNLSLIRVKALIDSGTNFSDQIQQAVYEAWVVGVI